MYRIPTGKMPSPAPRRTHQKMLHGILNWIRGHGMHVTDDRLFSLWYELKCFVNDGEFIDHVSDSIGM